MWTCVIGRSLVLFLAAAFLSSGCFSLHSALPLVDSYHEPVSIIVYVGRGEAYRYHDGVWQRRPSYDYEFSVVQRMLEDGWESVKEIYRRHPDYDGWGGDRDQTLYFRVWAVPAADGSRDLRLASSWGEGSGHADAAMEHIVVEFRPDISRFAPFNAFRITQRFSRQAGRLRETIEIFKRKDGMDTPFMKVEESAEIFTSTNR